MIQIFVAGKQMKNVHACAAVLWMFCPPSLRASHVTENYQLLSACAFLSCVRDQAPVTHAIWPFRSILPVHVTIIPPRSGIAGILSVSSPSPLTFTAGGKCRWAAMPRFSPSVSLTITILVATAAGPLRGRVPPGVRHLLKTQQIVR